jgi:hypothetical protein
MIVFAETAIWLLGKDKTLGTKKEINGMTCLHLLAKMPSAFRSSCDDMGKVKKLLYHCMSLATTLIMLCYVFFCFLKRCYVMLCVCL